MIRLKTRATSSFCHSVRRFVITIFPRCALRKLPVFVSTFDWLIALFTSGFPNKLSRILFNRARKKNERKQSNPLNNYRGQGARVACPYYIHRDEGDQVPARIIACKGGLG